MAGHSKWANIKHRKGRQDAARGKLFGKLAKAIEVAARDGGGNPDFNPTLATAVDKAKGASMPNDNIKRAVEKGSGTGDAGSLEEIVYEGYGPSGVAFIVEVVTDNKNRTTPEMRAKFDRFKDMVNERRDERGLDPVQGMRGMFGPRGGR